MSQENIFNCFLFGNKASGKASFLSHHIPWDNSSSNGGIPGKGVIMHPLIINTSVGKIQFNIWNIDGMHGECIVPTDCAIIFENCINRVTLKTCETFDLAVVIESIKVVMACADEPFKSSGDLNAAWMEKATKESMQLDNNNLPILESPSNLKKIFLWLSRKLCNDKNIEFLSDPVFLPRFFIRAQKTDQGLYCHRSSVMVFNAEQGSSTSSSESAFLREETTERKGNGASKSITKQ